MINRITDARELKARREARKEVIAAGRVERGKIVWRDVDPLNPAVRANASRAEILLSSARWHSKLMKMAMEAGVHIGSISTQGIWADGRWIADTYTDAYRYLELLIAANKPLHM